MKRVNSIVKRVSSAYTEMLLGRFLLQCLALTAISSIAAAQTDNSPTTVEYWVEKDMIQTELLQVQDFKHTITENTDFDLSDLSVITTLAISGRANLAQVDSLIRVLLIDEALSEHLVYEAYPLISPDGTFSVVNACRETCIADSVSPRLLRVEVINSSIDLDSLTTVNAQPTSAGLQSDPADIRALQNSELINQCNANIKRRGLRWVAGETPLSKLSYAEKKQTLCTRGEPSVPNLQGFEYYRSGIFELTPVDDSASSGREAESQFVDAFDWRTRHGANDPNSSYYDGDAAGSGWITSIKNQKCANCWAHCAVGAVEAKANLFFNKHVNLDLSEQQMVSCTGTGTCSQGGAPSNALRYARDSGIVDDACFVESDSDKPCNDVCPVPLERIRISDYQSIFDQSDENLKQQLIEFGPITFGIADWWHCMLLVGYETDIDGDTLWTIKNSWGESWGENGYGKLKVSTEERYLLNSIDNPIYSDIITFEVACYDIDGDGYANWGTGELKPQSCPDSEADRDCDDSDATLGPFNPDGSCQSISDFLPPPTGLRRDVYSSTTIELFWDREATPLTYEISRNGVSQVVIDGISYFDNTLTLDTTYQYDVVAMDSRGRKSEPATISVNTSIQGDPSLDAPANASIIIYSRTAAELFWDRAPLEDNIVTTKVFRNDVLIGEAEGNSYFDNTRTPDTNYQYKLIAVNKEGLSSGPTLVPDNNIPVDGPSAPKDFRSAVYSSTAIELFWSAAPVNESVVGYDIYRDEVLLAEALDVKSYFDDTLISNTRYAYKVVAVDSQGNRGSPESVELVTRN